MRLINYVKFLTKIILLLMVAVNLTGCGNKSEDEGQQSEISAQNALIEGESPSGMIFEDADFTYIYCGCEILKIAKNSEESTVIWKSDYKEKYASGDKAFLAGNKIYFLEEWWTINTCTTKKALSVIKTDGSGYCRMDEEIDRAEDMYFMDGVLYVSTWDDVILEYLLYADDTWEKKETALPKKYSKYNKIPPYDIFTGMQSLKKYGYMLFAKDDKIIKYVPESGEETEILENASMQASNQKYFLVEVDADGGKKWYLINMETLESRYLAEGNGSVIDMDEEYAYVARNDGNEEDEEGKCRIYEKVALTDGEISGIFTCYDIAKSFCDIGIRDNSLYYMAEKDYNLYLMRRSLNAPVEEALGDALYDSGISKVGSVEYYREKYYSEKYPDVYADVGLTSVDLERLVVDDRFLGAAKINAILKEEQEAVITMAKQDVTDLETYIEEMNGTHTIRYEYQSTIPFVFCHENRYLSFYQEHDDYLGGAHGMLYRDFYTFDLQSGERLKLGDVIENSEEEVKDIVTEYFAAYIENKDIFFDDALDTVRKWTDLDSDFYLTEKGICFYFPPYAIAPFCAGFPEVVIPYEEFDICLNSCL